VFTLSGGAASADYITVTKTKNQDGGKGNIKMVVRLYVDNRYIAGVY